MESEETLWISEGTMITLAGNAEEAEKKMLKGIVIVDDVYDVKPFDFSHVKEHVEDYRKKLRQKTIRKLKALERRR